MPYEMEDHLAFGLGLGEEEPVCRKCQEELDDWRCENEDCPLFGISQEPCEEDERGEQ